MNRNCLPFNLIDPIDKSVLYKHDLVYKGKENEYPFYNVLDKELINFKPFININEGSIEYQNETPVVDEKKLIPSNISYAFNYKDLAIQKLVKYIKSDNDVIIDLGCSNCSYLNKIPNRLIKIGVDISVSSMQFNTPNVFDSNVKYLWICNAINLPIPDSSIDLVLCCDILEHFMEPELLLNEIYRIIKPNGKIFISVPNLVSLGNRFSFLIGNGKGFQIAQILKLKNPFISIGGPRFPDQKKHIRWFTSSSLEFFLKQNNFKIIEKFGIGPFISRTRISHFFHSLSHLIGVIVEKNSE